MMVNLPCQFTDILNHSGDGHLSVLVGGYLHHVNWG